MRKIAFVLAGLVLALTVTACGSDDTNTDTTTHSTSFTCPTDNTKAFPKVRFAADLGLAFGSIKHWIYTPYQAGKLKKGADGRILATAKAVGAAALAAHLLSNATDNAESDPFLCKTVGKPLAELSNTVGGLKNNILHGNFGTLGGIVGGISSVSSLMSQNGAPVKETFQ